MIPPVPLIPRSQLFGNPSRAAAQISPDGAFLSWLAPVDGVLNVWICPADEAPEAARAITNDRKRGIRLYSWTYDGTHLVDAQDADGDENFHVYAVDPATRVTRDLTPFPGVTAQISGASRVIRDQVLVSMNQRDPKYFDLYRLHLGSGALEMVAENTEGFAGFVADEAFRVRFATKLGPDSVLQLMRHGEDGAWWMRWEAEDARASGPSGLNRAGSALFLRDSRARDTSALVRVDLDTGDTRVLAADERADIGGVLSDAKTGELLAYAVTVERTEFHAIDPSCSRISTSWRRRTPAIGRFRAGPRMTGPGHRRRLRHQAGVGLSLRPGGAHADQAV